MFKHRTYHIGVNLRQNRNKLLTTMCWQVTKPLNNFDQYVFILFLNILYQYLGELLIITKTQRPVLLADIIGYPNVVLNEVQRDLCRLGTHDEEDYAQEVEVLKDWYT